METYIKVSAEKKESAEGIQGVCLWGAKAIVVIWAAVKNDFMVMDVLGRRQCAIFIGEAEDVDGSDEGFGTDDDHV